MSASIPYTYVLKHKPTNTMYYGVRHAKNANPNDLFKFYFSSSIVVHALIIEFGVDSFEYQVRKTFDSKEKALAYEGRFLKKVKALTNPYWLNGTVNTDHLFQLIEGRTKNFFSCFSKTS